MYRGQMICVYKVLLPVFMVVLLFALAGCKKSKVDDCFSQPGKTIQEDRPASYFDEIEMYDNINVILVEGDIFSIKVEGGENLINSVNTDISDSTLVISSSLICNWVRSYENELSVIISSPALTGIRYESSGDLITDGSFNADTLNINVWGGAGSIKLDVSVRKLGLALHYGTVDFNVKGHAANTVIYANSYGPFYCSELISNNVYIKNYGTNDCYVYAHDILEAEITSVGNIYYKGNPRLIKCNDIGDGELIPF
mgnify:FL=1